MSGGLPNITAYYPENGVAPQAQVNKQEPSRIFRCVNTDTARHPFTGVPETSMFSFAGGFAMHLLIGFILFFLSSNAFSQNFDVRKAYWGMSPLEVQLSEGKPPYYEGGHGKYFEHWYVIRSGPNQWYPRIAEWRYYFDRNKLAKVYFTSNWAKDDLKKYEKELKYFSKLSGKDPKTVDFKEYRSHQWWVKDRTFVRTFITKKPGKSGNYKYEVVFYDAEHKKELDAKKK